MIRSGMRTQNGFPRRAGENRVYDLEERTARFGEAIIDFAKTVPGGTAYSPNH